MVSVGILAGGGEGPFMFVSKARLSLLEKTIHPNTFLSVRRHLNYLLKKVEKHRSEESGILLFDPVFSKDQLDLLSKQTKSTITYSNPITINEWLDYSFFKKLTATFLGEKIKSKSKNRPVFHLKWKAFYHSSHFDNWEKDIAISELIASSPLSISIDLLDRKNKKLIKGIDFDLSKTSLQRKLYELELIIDALSDYEIVIVHPVPKSKAGKIAFNANKEKFSKLFFRDFQEFKEIN